MAKKRKGIDDELRQRGEQLGVIKAQPAVAKPAQINRTGTPGTASYRKRLKTLSASAGAGSQSRNRSRQRKPK